MAARRADVKEAYRDLAPAGFRFFGVTIDQTHDAFRVANEFANAANVQACVVVPYGMNLDQIVAERVRATDVGIADLTRLTNTLEVFGVRTALAVLRERKEFLRLAERYG